MRDNRTAKKHCRYVGFAHVMDKFTDSPRISCGDCSVAHKSELIEILEFTHFFEHFTFDKTDYSERGKHMKKYIRVVVAVELVTVGAKIEPTS